MCRETLFQCCYSGLRNSSRPREQSELENEKYVINPVKTFLSEFGDVEPSN